MPKYGDFDLDLQNAQSNGKFGCDTGSLVSCSCPVSCCSGSGGGTSTAIKRDAKVIEEPCF